MPEQRLKPTCSVDRHHDAYPNPIALLQDVEHKFSKYGRVKEVRIVRNPATGESRGFGFVGMSEEDEVDAVRLGCTRRIMHSSGPLVACKSL